MDDKELEERLARLRGLPTSRKSDPPITVFINQQSSKTQIEQSDELLKKMIAEAALDTIHRESVLRRQKSTDEDIANRLARLRGLSHPLDLKTGDVHIEMDSDEERDQLIEKLVAEAALPDVSSLSKIPAKEIDRRAQEIQALDSESDGDADELPWCTLCNEDASVRCYGCENDLYCYRCFREFHRDPDMKKHKTGSYTKPKKSKNKSNPMH